MNYFQKFITVVMVLFLNALLIIADINECQSPMEIVTTSVLTLMEAIIAIA